MAPLNCYETIYIIKPGLEETLYEVIVNKYKRFAKRLHKGKVKSETWGEKKLAYPIDKYKTGYYVQMYFQAEDADIKKLEQEMTADPNVIKKIIVRHDEDWGSWGEDEVEEYASEREEAENEQDLYPNVKSKPVDVFDLIFGIEKEE